MSISKEAFVSGKSQRWIILFLLFMLTLEFNSCYTFRCRLQSLCDCSLSGYSDLSEYYIKFAELNTSSHSSNNYSGSVRFMDSGARKTGNVSCVVQSSSNLFDCELNLHIESLAVQFHESESSVNMCKCSCKKERKRNNRLKNSKHNMAARSTSQTLTSPKLCSNSSSMAEERVSINLKADPIEKRAELFFYVVEGTPGIFMWRVTVVQLSDGVDCSIPENGRKVFVKEKIITNNSTPVSLSIEPLLSGKYCARLYFLNDSAYNFCMQHFDIGFPDKPDAVTLPLKTDYVTDILVAFAGLIVAVCSLVLLYCCRKQRSENASNLRESVPFDWSMLTKKTVFLVYDRESDDYISLIHIFADVLESYCHCQVITDERNLSEVLRNVPTWIDKQIKENDIIIIVNSKGTYCWEADILQEKEEYEPSKKAVPPKNIFLIFLKTLISKQHLPLYYTKVFNIRFNHLKKHPTLTSITPNRIYEIPQDLQKLLKHIHKIDENSISESDWPVWNIHALEDKLKSIAMLSKSSSVDSQTRSILPLEIDDSSSLTNSSLKLLLSTDS